MLLIPGYYKDAKGKIIYVVDSARELGKKREIAIYWEKGNQRACAVSILRKRKLTKYDPGPEGT
jgi:rhodanese-related sulfurtransferase